MLVERDNGDGRAIDADGVLPDQALSGSSELERAERFDSETSSLFEKIDIINGGLLEPSSSSR